MLSQQVTKDFIVRQLEKLSTENLQEVTQFIEFIQFQTEHPLKQRKASRKHRPLAYGLNIPKHKTLLHLRKPFARKSKRGKMAEITHLVDTSMGLVLMNLELLFLR